MNKFRINDLVIIVSGSDKGKTGKIVKFLPKKNSVYIDGINMKKHVKPKQNSSGGIKDLNKPVNISNIAHYSFDKKKKSKIKIVSDKDSKKRILVLTNKEVKVCNDNKIFKRFI